MSDVPQADIARAAFRQLAERRLPPTPENYASAWAACGGNATYGEPVASARKAVRLLLRRAEMPAAHGDRLEQALERQDWSAVRTALDAIESLAAEAAPPVGDEAARLQRCLDRSERAFAELQRLLAALCDGIGVLSEDGSWLHGQVRSLQLVLESGADRHAVSTARQLLEQTASTQERLLERKRGAMRQLRDVLAQALGHVGSLGDSTGAFSRRMSDWVERLQEPDAAASFDVLLHELAADARRMQASVDRSRGDMVAAHDRARELETEVGRLERELADASSRMLTDHLTAALNRRGLDETWATVSQRCLKLGEPLSVALLDVDDFKKLNDAFGHLAGDGALQHLVRLLQAKLRPADSVARYGGEEFVLLLPGSDAAGAVQVMQRLQRELTRDVYLFESRQIFLTFSAGVAQRRDDEDLEALVARADQAMYRAKRAGKNCVAS